MESPQLVAKFLAITIVAGTVAAAVLGLATGRPVLLLDWFLILALLAVGCLLVSLVNLLIFGPIFWAISWLSRTRRHNRKQNEDPEQ